MSLVHCKALEEQVAKGHKLVTFFNGITCMLLSGVIGRRSPESGWGTHMGGAGWNLRFRV